MDLSFLVLNPLPFLRVLLKHRDDCSASLVINHQWLPIVFKIKFKGLFNLASLCFFFNQMCDPCNIYQTSTWQSLSLAYKFPMEGESVSLILASAVLGPLYGLYNVEGRKKGWD